MSKLIVAGPIPGTLSRSFAVVKLPWRGAGGSRGEVRIKLVSDHAMEVMWSATELGQSLALRAGTAVRMRQPD